MKALNAKATIVSFDLTPPRLLLLAAAVCALALGLGSGGHVQAAGTSSSTASLESTDQTSFLTAIMDSAQPSDDGDYTAILSKDGLFVSVHAGSVSFSLPGSLTLLVSAGDVIVVTGN